MARRTATMMMSKGVRIQCQLVLLTLICTLTMLLQQQHLRMVSAWVTATTTATASRRTSIHSMPTAGRICTTCVISSIPLLLQHHPRRQRIVTSSQKFLARNGKDRVKNHRSRMTSTATALSISPDETSSSPLTTPSSHDNSKKDDMTAKSSPYSTESNTEPSRTLSSYDLGAGKNPPVVTAVSSPTPKEIYRSSKGEEIDEEEQKQSTDSQRSSKENVDENDSHAATLRRYDLGIGKNQPLVASKSNENTTSDLGTKIHWNAPVPAFIMKPPPKASVANRKAEVSKSTSTPRVQPRTVRRMVARSQESSTLRGAIWHEQHYSNNDDANESNDEIRTAPKGNIPFASRPREDDHSSIQSYTSKTGIPGQGMTGQGMIGTGAIPRPPSKFYPNIDLSIPLDVYDPSGGIDVVWDLLRYEAWVECQREPLLVSFLYSSILNHPSLESSLAFILANKLASPAMISTQVQSLISDVLSAAALTSASSSMSEDEIIDDNINIGRAVRADIMAVRDRDPACTCLPDVFLYFKGFHALQTYRVAHSIWLQDKFVLAHYLQSQMSQTFQIDIHPNAILGRGIMLDHGHGIVIGETSHVGHNCSILHHVTLGGSGKKGVDRHPKVANGVLLGAGTTILGPVKIGDGCQVGAGGLVITDLPPHSVAVGVPVKIIGSFIDVTEQPSIEMNQMMDDINGNRMKFIETFQSEGI